MFNQDFNRDGNAGKRRFGLAIKQELLIGVGVLNLQQVNTLPYLKALADGFYF